MDLVLTLHSHLPYLLGHGRWPHGSDWLCEATLDSYLPLLCMLRALEIPRAWLPEVTESPVVNSRVGPAAARQTGLAEGTPVVAGAGDQAAQAGGGGSVDEGSVSITPGTSGVVFAASRRCRVHPTGRLHAFCHAVPGLWHLMGVMLSAGGSLSWYRETFAAAEGFETLLT